MIIKSSVSGGFEVEVVGWRVVFVNVPGWFSVHLPWTKDAAWSDMRPAAVAAREREHMEYRQGMAASDATGAN